MTEDQLKEIEDRANAATYGPWEHLVTDRVWNTAGMEKLKNTPLADSLGQEHQVVTSWIHGQAHDKVAIFAVGISWCFETPYSIHVRPEDSEFVAHAREDIPALIAEVRRLKSVVHDL